MPNSTKIAGTEIEKGDLIMCPVSRQETVPSLEVVGVEDDRVYLDKDGKRFTMCTEDAIAFATLTANDGSFGPTEILAVEKYDMGDEEFDTQLEDIDLGGE